MLARSWFAILLLANYLLVVGVGCVNRPEDQHELVLVQTNADGNAYQQCRYLRMDGLADFLNEALTTRYQNASETAKHHLISVVGGVDAHCLSQLTQPPTVPPLYRLLTPMAAYQSIISLGVYRATYTPPEVR